MNNTKVFIEDFKGKRMFAVWVVDSNGLKVGEYPVISFGSKKAACIAAHLDDLKSYVLEEAI